MFNWYRISMCFTCFLCQFVFNKRFLKMYCLSVHSFFLVPFTSMYTTLKIISRKFLGVSLIWTFFSHVGAIFFKQPICSVHMLFFLLLWELTRPIDMQMNISEGYVHVKFIFSSMISELIKKWLCLLTLWIKKISTIWHIIHCICNIGHFIIFH